MQCPKCDSTFVAHQEHVCVCVHCGFEWPHGMAKVLLEFMAGPADGGCMFAAVDEDNKGRVFSLPVMDHLYESREPWQGENAIHLYDQGHVSVVDHA